MDGQAATTAFVDSWVWLIFLGLGLLMVLGELFMGIDTGLDLVFIGSAFIIGGLVTWPFHSWALALIVTAIICLAYFFLGRRYVHQRMAVKTEMTNIDTIIGRKGTVLKDITPAADGRIIVDGVRWRARADVEIPEGAEVTVTGVRGTTLTVEKIEGGN